MSTPFAVLLGVVQGLTEFIPVSSKTHLVVVPALLGRPAPDLGFIVLLHLGTLVGLVAYLAGDLRQLLRDRRELGLVLIASAPAAGVGVLFQDTFEALIESPRPAAFMLVITAVLLWAAERLAGRARRGLPRPLRDAPRVRDAVGMGVAQAAALFPGVSRSGSTMAAGLVLGLGRAAAARFSFLMAMVAIAGANVLELPEVVDHGLGMPEVAGFAAAAVSGYAAVGFLLRYLRERSFLPFAAYCLAFGLGAGILLG